MTSIYDSQKQHTTHAQYTLQFTKSTANCKKLNILVFITIYGHNVNINNLFHTFKIIISFYFLY